eukprot:6199432-Pleurochrysis_carterae.AAC.5
MTDAKLAPNNEEKAPEERPKRQLQKALVHRFVHLPGSVDDLLVLCTIAVESKRFEALLTVLRQHVIHDLVPNDPADEHADHTRDEARADHAEDGRVPVTLHRRSFRARTMRVLEEQLRPSEVLVVLTEGFGEGAQHRFRETLQLFRRRPESEGGECLLRRTKDVRHAVRTRD